MTNYEEFFNGKRVFLTGHTGFTGSWAALWLLELGAKVYGYAREPETSPSLYNVAKVGEGLSSTIGDISDLVRVKRAMDNSRPDIVIHLAAQPLVRRSYREPFETFSSNVMGTVSVLEAARLCRTVKAVVCITTDKVYKNNEWIWAYRENDTLGGKDPYSASKAAAEFAIESYMESYPFTEGNGPPIAIARGGNIIGGGDWAEDRLIPDFVRAVVNGKTLKIRYPNATRPWQHVLALVKGYFMLAAALFTEPEKYSQAWNFGPIDRSPLTVAQVLQRIVSEWSDPGIEYETQALPESQSLNLDSTRARSTLGWEPLWDTEQTIRRTTEWYRDFYADPRRARELCLKQITLWREKHNGTK